MRTGAYHYKVVTEVMNVTQMLWRAQRSRLGL